jgi:hypothetical protein
MLQISRKAQENDQHIIKEIITMQIREFVPTYWE